jgi:hypothetical protein
MSKSSHRAKGEHTAFWDKVWTALVVASLLVIIGYSIYIQIIHHTWL